MSVGQLEVLTTTIWLTLPPVASPQGSPKSGKAALKGTADVPHSVPSYRSYRVSLEFRVPVEFAYAWCTDYRPDDGKYGGEDRTIHLQRRIISRNRRRVVFENLYDEDRGWGWERHTVSLKPPTAWRSVGKGNRSESILDYKLAGLADERTRFDMRWKSRPTPLAKGSRPSDHAVENYVTKLWRKRARAMERDYRQAASRG